jgi:hypothetical protein
MGDYFQFGSVFIKKSNQTEFFLNKTKTGSNRPVLVRFFRTKTNSNRSGSVFSVWLGFFSGLALFFSGLGSVRFDFFGFRLIKPKLS